MKTIIREMVETIKQLFAQKQQMQEPIVANCKIPGVVAQKTLKKKEEPEKTGEKTGKTPVIIVSFTRKNRGKTGSLPSERGCLSVLLC